MVLQRRRTSLTGNVELEALGGMVRCPVRGDSDVERCVECPYLWAAELREGVLHIQCRPVTGQVSSGEILSVLRA